MAKDTPSFLDRVGESLVFNGDGEFIFYVPDIYFDRGDAIITGEFVNILGIMDYSVFDKNGKSITGLKPFYFPTVFLTKPSQIDKMKGVKLTKSQSADDYRLLRYKKGDTVVVSTKVPEDAANIEALFRIILTGKIPTTIPVTKIQDYMIDNVKFNGESYGVNIQIFGILIAALAVSKSDPSVEFRHTNWTDPTSYRLLPIKEKPKFTSPSQSITSENWDNAIIGAIMNPTDVETPMEKLITG